MYRRLRDLREDHDLSQKKLSALIGMSQTGYSKYETGENDIPTDILIKLSRLYDVSVDYLLGETNDPKRHEPLYFDVDGSEPNLKKVISKRPQKADS